MADDIEALRSVVRKVFGPDEGINVDPEAMRDGDLWWCTAEAIETTAAERAAIDAALAGVAAEPNEEPRTQLHIGNPMCVCSHMRDEHDDQGDCKGEWRGGECFCDAFDEGNDDD